MNVTYGVYFPPEEFVEKALKLRRPFDEPLPLDESNLRSIAFILEQGPAKVAKHRVEALKYYVMRARELASKERALHEALDESLKPVLASKRLVLFKEMLTDAGVNGESIFKDMCNGFRLVGDLPPAGQFKQQFKPASLSVEQLKQAAIWSQRAVVGECKKVGSDPEIAKEIGEESAERQWVRGPFTAAQIPDRQGPNWIPSRRFGVRQGNKIRPVDDFSQYLINASIACHEKIDLEGIDNICAVARFFMGGPERRRKVLLALSGRDGLGLLAPSCEGGKH